MCSQTIQAVHVLVGAGRQEMAKAAPWRCQRMLEGSLGVDTIGRRMRDVMQLDASGVAEVGNADC
jgi:hypothetical protein